MKRTARSRGPLVPIIFIILVAAAAVIGIVAAGLGLYGRGETPATSAEINPGGPAPFVRTATAANDKTVRDSVVQNMSIEAVKRVNLIPRVTGRLERLHVKQGDKVKAGQIIATLEHEQQDALISATEAQLASAKADSERARAEMMNAKTNLDRYERLVKEGFSTQQQFDTIETAHTSARASYNAALARERQVASELERVRSSRRDYIIHSPLDGTVLNDYAMTPGAMISPSSPIVDIADMRRLKASLRIPENKIFAIKPGMDVFLKFDALPDEEFQGQVTRIDPYVDPATRTSAVEIELDNEAIGNRLRPGMFGQASIVEREFKNAVLLPESALNSGTEGYYVFVEEDGIARRRNVTTGLRQGGLVQITGGVMPEESVIVFGGNNLNDGDKVEIQR
ncbi:MAG: efflux RND transporter periplasmic adaptor subunit [Synergistaceae bacterium]|jgi:RND family efflux transporter MFP subunit|nr:efflux RND transporter periplasmic adaptor subunit [Synergistaceae bacterium]